mmetsp:Transcript_10832/g.31521  ORF Transcript_10832/g.31521 Transcript_10832/m.31521 type:complete len:260 (-) Transcript_10832:718-1497(-)
MILFGDHLAKFGVGVDLVAEDHRQSQLLGFFVSLCKHLGDVDFRGERHSQFSLAADDARRKDTGRQCARHQPVPAAPGSVHDQAVRNVSHQHVYYVVEALSGHTAPDRATHPAMGSTDRHVGVDVLVEPVLTFFAEGKVQKVVSHLGSHRVAHQDDGQFSVFLIHAFDPCNHFGQITVSLFVDGRRQPPIIGHRIDALSSFVCHDGSAIVNKWPHHVTLSFLDHAINEVFASIQSLVCSHFVPGSFVDHVGAESNVLNP